MSNGNGTTPAYPVLSRFKIILISTVSGLMVSSVVLLSQWLIYDDWLHRSGPLRIIGTLVSGALTFVFVHRWQSLVRERQIETVRRFERIARMNDRIRNSLQAIECVTFVAQPQAMDTVHDAVENIDAVLGEVLLEMRPGVNPNRSVPSVNKASATTL
jgi:hypothetical protein